MKRLLTEENVRAYREGRITFEAFAEQTRDEWIASARWLLRRWRCPTDVTEEDLVQEMLVGCFLAVDAWDPKRGNPLRRHARFCALHAAMKWMHRRRNALRRDGKAPGRWEIPFSELGDGERELEFAAPEQEPEIPREIDVEQEAWRLLACQLRREALGVETHAQARAVAEIVGEFVARAGERGEESALDGIAAEVVQDPDRAVLFRVRDFEQARRRVRGVVRVFARAV